jgi:hypothetical protein
VSNNIYVSNLSSPKIQMRLQLSPSVLALANDDLSLSGSIGIVPIKITNLFSNAAQLIRVGIGSDNTIFEDLWNQGGVKIKG